MIKPRTVLFMGTVDFGKSTHVRSLYVKEGIHLLKVA